VRIFVFLHVATMFGAVAMSVGVPLLLRRIGQAADVPTIRRSFIAAQPLVGAIPLLFALGAALGVVAIFTEGLNPFVPFLLIAYGLFILETVVGIVLTNPWFRRAVKLSAESPDEAPSAELLATLHDPRMVWFDWLDRFVILAFIFDMIVKPFS
jgi:hypothetical protein